MDSIESRSGNQQPEQSTLNESVYILLSKPTGKEDCELTMNMSSAITGLAGLTMILKKYSEFTGYQMTKVLILLRLALERLEGVRWEEEDPHD